MRRIRSARYCRCGTRLAYDNSGALCGVCQAKARDLALGPPDVPDGFWENDRLRDVLADWHFGRVIAAYRNHPFHGRPIPQEIAAGWMGIRQPQLSRIENGPPVQNLDRLIYWARIFKIPPHLLWFKLPEHHDCAPTHVPLVRMNAAVPNFSRTNQSKVTGVGRLEGGY